MIWPAVVLSVCEARQAAMCGVENRLRGMTLGRANAYGYRGPGWDLQIEGRLAEQAFAKLTGRYVADSADLDHDGDVGAGVQVRSTCYRPPLLRVNAPDHDDHVFILAVGQGLRWEFPGWILGGDAKRPELWRESVNGVKLRAGAYYVAAAELKPIPPSRIAATPVAT